MAEGREFWKGTTVALASGTSGREESGNTTFTALGAGETYTGVWEDLSKLNSVILSISCDVDCTAFMEFSPNGRDTTPNVDKSLSIAVTGGEHRNVRQIITSRFYRLRVVAGAAMSELRAETIYGYHGIPTDTNNSIGVVVKDANGEDINVNAGSNLVAQILTIDQLDLPCDIYVVDADGFYITTNDGFLIEDT